MDSYLAERGNPVVARRIAEYWTDGVCYWLDVQKAERDLVFVVRRWDRIQPVRIDRGHQSWWTVIRTPPVEEIAMGWLKRAAEADAQRSLKRSGEDLKWAAAHPALNEYLTADKYPDGGQRLTATLLVFQEGGEWKACLRDRDTARTLWCSAGSLPELLEALDEVLQSEDAQWRKDRQTGNPSGKKRG